MDDDRNDIEVSLLNLLQKLAKLKRQFQFISAPDSSETGPENFHTPDVALQRSI